MASVAPIGGGPSHTSLAPPPDPADLAGQQAAHRVNHRIGVVGGGDLLVPTRGPREHRGFHMVANKIPSFVAASVSPAAAALSHHMRAAGRSGGLRRVAQCPGPFITSGRPEAEAFSSQDSAACNSGGSSCVSRAPSWAIASGLPAAAAFSPPHARTGKILRVALLTYRTKLDHGICVTSCGSSLVRIPGRVQVRRAPTRDVIVGHWSPSVNTDARDRSLRRLPPAALHSQGLQPLLAGTKAPGKRRRGCWFPSLVGRGVSRHADDGRLAIAMGAGQSMPRQCLRRRFV